ncbi:MAG TPA: DUF2231 domain-containing protein [Jatrophihabitantaceae bacterium]|nr:DUF2231 domain-containing protein [Jatrophihabitantaceae bacterium]
MGSPFDPIVENIAQQDWLDSVAVPVQRIVEKVIAPGPIEDTLSGEFLGHPLHPALVALPIGSWLGVNVLDLTGGDGRAARRLLAFGNLAALASAAAGATDWRRTTGAARRIGLVHAVLNDAALALNLASSVSRRRDRRARGAVLSLAASGVTAASGWLGGHLAYTLGVGVRATESPALPLGDDAERGRAVG